MLHTTMESRSGGGSPCPVVTVEDEALVSGRSVALSDVRGGRGGSRTGGRTHSPIGTILTLPAAANNKVTVTAQ